MALRGPADVPGQLWFYTGAPGGPAPRVMLDGVALRASNGSAATEGADSFTFDAATGLVNVRFTQPGLQPPRTRVLEIVP
jgi:hypothetical protein